MSSELKAEELIANYADNWLTVLNISENVTKLQIPETCLDFCINHLLDEISRAESVVIMDAIYQDGNNREPITGAMEFCLGIMCLCNGVLKFSSDQLAALKLSNPLLDQVMP